MYVSIAIPVSSTMMEDATTATTDINTNSVLDTSATTTDAITTTTAKQPSATTQMSIGDESGDEAVYCTLGY